MDSMDPMVAPVRLAAAGVARFAGAAFLAVWLCGWAVGECFAGGLWLALLCEWIAPGALASLGIHAPVIKGAPGIPIFAFLSMWLTFWTVGGLAAIDTLLRSLWGSDEIRIESGHLIAVRRNWPFSSRREIELGSLQALRLRRKDRALLAVTARGEHALTDLGTVEQRTALRDTLRSHLASGATPSAGPLGSGGDGLPEGWQSDYDLEGRTVLTRDARVRRNRAIVAWVVSAVSGVLCWQVVIRIAAGDGLQMATPFVVVALLFFASLLAAAWLQFGRSEIVVSASRFGIRRRFAHWQRWTDFGAARLRVEVRTDSDGDEWFELVAGDGKPRHVLRSALNESADVVALGTWLANRLGTRLELDARVAEG